MSDTTSPDHYQHGAVECKDWIAMCIGRTDTESFFIGNVLKYVYRYKHKGGIEDLKKARRYLDFYIESASAPYVAVAK